MKNKSFKYMFLLVFIAIIMASSVGVWVFYFVEKLT